MTLFRPPARVVAPAVGVVLIAAFLTGCDDRSTHLGKTPRAEEQRHAELQAQLQTEQAKRLEAEKAAEVAKSSRATWIIALVAAGSVVCLVALLIGVHIGSRSINRDRKEQLDG